MDEHMMIDSLNESYDSFSESIKDSDTDPLFQIENESNTDFDDSTEDEDEEGHSISVHNNVQPLQPAWNIVSGNNQNNSCINNSTLN